MHILSPWAGMGFVRSQNGYYPIDPSISIPHPKAKQPTSTQSDDKRPVKWIQEKENVWRVVYAD